MLKRFFALFAVLIFSGTYAIAAEGEDFPEAVKNSRKNAVRVFTDLEFGFYSQDGFAVDSGVVFTVVPPPQFEGSWLTVLGSGQRVPVLAQVGLKAEDLSFRWLALAGNLSDISPVVFFSGKLNNEDTLFLVTATQIGKVLVGGDESKKTFLLTGQEDAKTVGIGTGVVDRLGRFYGLVTKAEEKDKKL